MDFKTQNGQASQPQSTQPQPQRSALGASFGGPAGGRAGLTKVIALVVGLLVIVALAIGMMLFTQPKSSSSSQVDTGKYQAIFLTNGQVYFGKLSDINKGYVNITDVYYLQVQQAVQPADTKTESGEPKVSLTKLGNELHGPTDEMHISRDQVLFWENLKEDSTVVKAISDYKSKQ